MKQVFISYRRADSGSLAEELAQWVRSVFGRTAVFIDTGDVPTGSLWAAVLESRLEGMASLLCVIGEQWTGSEGDGRRIDDPNDWVRREIRSAIDRRIPVLPVVADRAHVPAAHELPEDLRPMLEVQSLTFQGSDADVQDLIDWLTPHLVPSIEFVDPLTVDQGSLSQASEAFVDRLGPSSRKEAVLEEDMKAREESDRRACRVRQPVAWHSILVAATERPEVPSRVREDVLSLLKNVERRLTPMWVGFCHWSGFPTQGGQTARAGINLLRFASLLVLNRLGRYGAVPAEVQPPLKYALRWEEDLDRFFREPEEIADARVTRISGIDILPEPELSIYGPCFWVKQAYFDTSFSTLRTMTTDWYGEYLAPQLELLLAARARREMVRYDGLVSIRKVVDLDGNDIEIRWGDHQ